MIPLNLKINNFFSHKVTEIDFTKFDAALLIGNVEGDYSISNGSGKSAIFEAILWCLFNKARTAQIDDIIMWNESSCSVSFEFIHNSEKYRVIRTRSRTTGTSTVEFHIDDSAAWKDQSGSTARLTNAKIIETIRVDYKTFINSAYFRQNDISEFAESDAGRKKEILKSIIDISKWDEYEKAA
ncbi:MAG: SMC family ATPase, partial [Polaribacter sp.]|nr:SMC family ATPase [Polaribacter sp.]